MADFLELIVALFHLDQIVGKMEMPTLMYAILAACQCSPPVNMYLLIQTMSSSFGVNDPVAVGSHSDGILP